MLLCRPISNPLIEKEGHLSNNGVTSSLSLPLCAVKMLPSWFLWKEGELLPLTPGVLQAPGHRNTLPLQLNQIWTPRWHCPRAGGNTAGLCCDGSYLREGWARDRADTTGWWVIEHIFFSSIYFFLLIWFCQVFFAACGILVPWSGIKPRSPALGAWCLSSGPPGKSQ